MTRVEEILEAGIKYTMQNNPCCIGGDNFYERARELNRNRPFEAGAQWADEHTKSPWIAVEDKLPEIGQAVFIRTSKSTYGVSWIDYDLDWQGGVGYSPLIVTHWMPIPNLPKE